MKYDGFNENIKPEDWFGIDDARLSQLQPIRKIEKKVFELDEK